MRNGVTNIPMVAVLRLGGAGGTVRENAADTAPKVRAGGTGRCPPMGAVPFARRLGRLLGSPIVVGRSSHADRPTFPSAGTRQANGSTFPIDNRAIDGVANRTGGSMFGI